MHRTALRQASLCSMLVSALALSGAAQGRARPKQRPASAPPSAAAAMMGADSLNNLKFRNLGPSVGGGRVAAVVGVAGDRSTYYVGASAGGVWKTTDGGDSWEAVFKDQPTASIGAVALAPSNPNVVWVGTGEGNPRKDGLPTGLLGRIALAVGPTNPSHVYALIETKQGMLWDSKDQGDHWTKVSDNHALSARPFYFSLMHVSPVDDRKVFFSSYLLLRSDDGGKTTTPIDRGVHVDHHALWIDPQNPDRIIQGNDGGAYVTESGAKNWRYLNNLPIEQFYMVAADNNTPYMLCGGLQDNNAWCGPSSGTAGGGGAGGAGGSGGLNGSEWFTVTGGD